VGALMAALACCASSKARSACVSFALATGPWLLAHGVTERGVSVI